MRKKHKRRSRSHNFLGLNRALTISILTVTMLFLTSSIIIVTYNVGFEDAKNEKSEVVYKIREENRLLRERLKENLASSNTTIYKSDKSILNIKKPIIIERRDVIAKETERREKPKLAIVLDDVSFASEVRAVKAIGIKVNFSFFPPSKAHPSTARLAKKEPFYMVHLPLEAMNFSAEEPHTLHVGDSFEKIKNRLIEIKKKFPRLLYVNNHTGSKFTSHLASTKKLYKALRELDMDIMDSRTIAKTKLPEIYANNDRALFSRDIFLDHESDVNYICGQIKLAVNKAKENGSAIAIGHPRKNTIKALKRCKSVLQSVELVYLHQL